jgi:hypothetical protein
MIATPEGAVLHQAGDFAPQNSAARFPRAADLHCFASRLRAAGAGTLSSAGFSIGRMSVVAVRSSNEFRCIAPRSFLAYYRESGGKRSGKLF